MIPLVVKSTCPTISDHLTEARSGWTVAHLKHHLQLTHPNQPQTTSQKLIYSGRLLTDSLLLEDVFRHLTPGEVHTLHLMCDKFGKVQQKVAATIPSQPATIPSQPATSPSQPTVSQTPPDNNQAASDNLGDGPASVLRYRGHHHGVADSSSNHWQPSQQPASGVAASQYPDEYVSMVHQLYTHYWRQLSTSNPSWQPAHPGNQAWQPAHPGNQAWQPAHPGNHGWQQQPSAATTNQVPQQPAMSAAAAAAAAATPQPPPPPAVANAAERADDVVMNGQGRADNVVMDAQGRLLQLDEDDGNDWLDWSYVLLRVTLILSVLYFYSSMARFILVGAICALIAVVYVVRRDWNQDRQQPRNQQQQQQQQPPPPQPHAPAAPAAGQEQPPSILETIVLFVYNFFTSLVPQMPQAL